MWGLWIGNVDINRSGTETRSMCMVCIDLQTQNEGVLQLFAPGRELSSGISGATFELRLSNASENALFWTAHLRKAFDATFADTSNPTEFPEVTLEGKISPAGSGNPLETLELKAFQNSVQVAAGTLQNTELDIPEFRLKGTAKTWAEFRRWALEVNEESQAPYIFRGHKSSRYALSSSLHRTGRRNMLKYHEDNVPRLKRHFEAHTGKTVDLSNIDEYMGLLTFAQHHGYPTPLLDWTESPFVAAYFAFEDHRQIDPEDLSVRIYCLDSMLVRMNPPPRHIVDPRYCLHPSRYPSPGNPRALAQQSIYMLTTVGHCESLLSAILHSVKDVENYRPSLAIDILRSEKAIAMRDLRLMGINAASIYGGMDGVFKAQRELDFL